MAPTGPPAQMSRCTLYDDVKSVMVEVDGEQVEVEIDPEEGPKLLRLDGNPGGPNDIQRFLHTPPTDRPRCSAGNPKPWKFWTATEREVAVRVAAKKNKARLANKASGVQIRDATLSSLF
eukprot:TRINITY_DN112313_c0_g1_i1.p1 TRINITY_DN112313_c0_g1~~TRINITY_DN112313_c0_g1_i1.p1  ORF type:complete len:139 (-),score=17.01 TRINITY_DN112313_c0_g1_i1:15-374(-)